MKFDSRYYLGGLLLATVFVVFLWPPQVVSVNEPESASPSVWALYVGQWGNTDHDGKWVYWRMRRFSHSKEYFEPPFSLGISHYPSLGLYSSHDETTLRNHFILMNKAGIDVAVLQWWGKSQGEPNIEETEGFSENTLKLMLNISSEYKIKICVQMQPYGDRNNQGFIDDVKYLCNNYAKHPSFLKMDGRPVLIVYDPHNIPHVYLAIEELRQSEYNPYLIASIVEKNHYVQAIENGFNGIFTYFATIGSTWGTNLTHWPTLSKSCKERNMLFVPSVSPGYNDEKSIPWSRGNKRGRESGRYYDKMWQAAVDSKPSVVMINSFNHFYDGTPIEPTLSREGYEWDGDNWASGTTNSDFYIQRTKYWVDLMKKQ